MVKKTIDPNQGNLFDPPKDPPSTEVPDAETKQWLDERLTAQYGSPAERQTLLERVKARNRFGEKPPSNDLPF